MNKTILFFLALMPVSYTHLYNKPYLLEVPYLENEINTIFNLRSEVIF